MANNNQNKKVVYSEGSNPSKIIIEILKRNGLEETLEEKLKKIKRGGTRGVSPFIIIDKIAKEIADEKISVDKAIIYLQEQLKTPKEAAEKIAEDIKTMLVPLTEKIIDTDEETETPEILTKIKPPIGVMGTEEKAKILTNSLKKNNRINKPIKEEIEKFVPKYSSKPKQPRQQDSYREPIE